jgi:hypothetical protein
MVWWIKSFTNRWRKSMRIWQWFPGRTLFELPLIMHPTGPVRRTNLYNMVLILLSIIVAAIAVTISVTPRHSPFGGFTRSGIVREEIAKARERAEQPATADRTKQFLVVVLPDGKIVNPVLADLL